MASMGELSFADISQKLDSINNELNSSFTMGKEQKEIIHNDVTFHTGFGKSECFGYVIPLLNELLPEKNSLVLVICPLKAIIQDQVRRWERLGIKAAAIRPENEMSKQSLKEPRLAPGEAINISPQSHTHKPEDSLEETVRKFINKYCTGPNYDMKSTVSVKEMRHVVPTLMLLLYANRQDQSQRKVKGIWNKKPKNWPPGVPFADPNNKKEKSKPRKEALQQMTHFLLQEYGKHEDGGLPTQEVGPDHPLSTLRRSPPRHSPQRPILQRVVSEEDWRPAEEIIERCQKKTAVVKLDPDQRIFVQEALNLLEEQAPNAYDSVTVSAYMTLAHDLERAMDLALVVKTLTPDEKYKLRSGINDLRRISTPYKGIRTVDDVAGHGEVTANLDNLTIQSPHPGTEDPRVNVVQPLSNTASPNSSVAYETMPILNYMPVVDTVNLNPTPGADVNRVTYLGPEYTHGAYPQHLSHILRPGGQPLLPYYYHVVSQDNQPQQVHVLSQGPENKTFMDLSNVQQSPLGISSEERFFSAAADGALEPAEVVIDGDGEAKMEKDAHQVVVQPQDEDLEADGMTIIETNVGLQDQQVPVKTEAGFCLGRQAQENLPDKPVATAVLQVSMAMDEGPLGISKPADQVLPGTEKAISDCLSFQSAEDKGAVVSPSMVVDKEIYDTMDIGGEEEVIDDAEPSESPPTDSPTPFIPTVVSKLEVPSYHTTLSDSMKPPRKRKRCDMKYT